MANYFTILYWFCHSSIWIRHGCTQYYVTKKLPFLLLLFSSVIFIHAYSLPGSCVISFCSGCFFFFFLSFSLVYQCLSVVQMKYHILLLPIYCGVLYFGCVLKYNLAMFLGGGEENSRDYGEVFSLFHLH